MTTAGRASFIPSPSLRVLGTLTGAYRYLFAGSRVAPLLSRPDPVRRTGFERRCAVTELQPVAADVVHVTLAAADGEELARWQPGAHIDVTLASGRQRQYSLCGDPHDRHTYRIAVRRIDDGGGGSREIHETLAVGDEITVRGPRNALRLVSAPSYLFVAGGIGITPILPMVKTCHRRGVPWRLLYLGRSRTTMPFLDDLAGLDTGTVEVHADDEHGTASLESVLASADAGAAAYLCGPPGLMDSARRGLGEINPSASVHMERFAPPPVIDGRPFEARLERSGTSVDVADDESALAAIRREVPGVPYSCRQGFCGTCRTRVLAGSVDHRDRILSDDERADTMLICVSRAAHDRLVLDL
ncbi:PDR/VanB family oxidoreductase [Prauserella halophila]|uniref:PDR/VanB family oxidoreductase n=1 Tax=Prauserella halophila TaxID=185641 RepID=A0ABN1VZB1_9PSEU|nr:PDR/VanB family oxidoreductase [Prauserella halophila]MCP2237214.1 Ferredoxin-NADP reductase [Prauserella halophila]